MLSLTCGLLAQGSQSYLGVEIGAGVRNLTGNFEEKLVGEYLPGVGLSGGIGIEKILSEELSVKLSILFANKGAVSRWTEYDSNGNQVFSETNSVNFLYLSMPILFKHSLGKKRRYFVVLGPYFSSLVKHPHSRFNQSLDYLEDGGAFDWGFSGGLGRKFSISKQMYFSVEVRHDWGLHDISDFSFLRISYGGMQTRYTQMLCSLFWEIQ